MAAKITNRPAPTSTAALSSALSSSGGLLTTTSSTGQGSCGRRYKATEKIDRSELGWTAVNEFGDDGPTDDLKAKKNTAKEGQWLWQKRRQLSHGKKTGLEELVSRPASRANLSIRNSSQHGQWVKFIFFEVNGPPFTTIVLKFSHQDRIFDKVITGYCSHIRVHLFSYLFY